MTGWIRTWRQQRRLSPALLRYLMRLFARAVCFSRAQYGRSRYLSVQRLSHMLNIPPVSPFSRMFRALAVTAWSSSAPLRPSRSVARFWLAGRDRALQRVSSPRRRPIRLDEALRHFDDRCHQGVSFKPVLRILRVKCRVRQAGRMEMNISISDTFPIMKAALPSAVSRVSSISGAPP